VLAIIQRKLNGKPIFFRFQPLYHFLIRQGIFGLKRAVLISYAIAANVCFVGS